MNTAVATKPAQEKPALTVTEPQRGGRLVLAQIQQDVEKVASNWAAALPPQISVDKFKQVFFTALNLNPALLGCTKRSLFNAARAAAIDGLLPDGKQGAMVVRKNWKDQTNEVQWQPMIAGLRIKVRNSGEIITWEQHLVHEKDHFDYRLGDDPFIDHKPAMKDRGPIIAAYSIASYKWGEQIVKSREVMTVDEINAIRDEFSEGWKAFTAKKIKSTPWSTSYGEMAKKTVARRHAKVLPLSSDLHDFVERYLNDGDEAAPPARSAEPPSATRPQITDYTDVAEDADPETGEIQDQQTTEQPQEEQKAEEEISTIGPPEAYEIGRKARDEGKALRAVPGDWRDEQHAALADAWTDGWRARDDEINAAKKGGK